MYDNNTKYYHINHKYRDKVIVPYVAITDNCEFVLDNTQKRLIFAEGIKGIVSELEEKNILDIQSEIECLYGLSAWDFLCKWYSAYPYINSLYFFIIKAKKEG